MEVLQLIQAPITSIEREHFGELYERAFPPVARFVSKMNGTLNDAKDIFHDALVIFHEKTAGGKFFPSTSPEAYILGIAKHLWVRKFKTERRVLFNEIEMAITLPEDIDPSPNDHKLLAFLEKTGKKCLDLLHAFYYDRNSIKEITARLGSRNDHSTTVQTYTSLEKMRQTVKEIDKNYEDFLE